MMIPMGELLAKAKKEGYGVAAPNVFNRETIGANCSIPNVFTICSQTRIISYNVLTLLGILPHLLQLSAANSSFSV